MINRTISLFARTEAKDPSTNTQFERNFQSPSIMERVKDFRLFTCLVAFCKLAMRKCAWLHPDLGLARKTWEEGDRILSDEYGMPRPEPRRAQRRSEVCQTQAIMEAVARVFLFKQVCALSLEAPQDVFIELVCPSLRLQVALLSLALASDRLAIRSRAPNRGHLCGKEI